MSAPSRCRVCLCVCTDEEHALTEAQADALGLDAMTALVCFDCWRKAMPRQPALAPQVGAEDDLASYLADRYPVAVSL